MGCIQPQNNSLKIVNSYDFQQHSQISQIKQQSQIVKKNSYKTNEDKQNINQNQNKKNFTKKLSALTNRYYRHGVQDELVVQILMQKRDEQIIVQTLKKNPFFKPIFQYELTQSVLIFIFQKIKKKQSFYGQYIFRQGDQPDNFYIIRQGRVAIEMNCEIRKSIGSGESFGQQAIIYDCQRFKSAKVCTQKCILYSLGKKQVLQIFQKLNKRYRNQIQNIFKKKVHFYHFLTNKQKADFILHTYKLKLKKDEVIFQQNYEANSFYIISQGKILITIENKKDIILKDGQSFGESAFLQEKGIRMGNAISLEETIIFGIGSSFIKKILGNTLNCVIQYNLEKWSLYRNQFLSKLNENKRIPYGKIIQQFHIVKGKKFDLLQKKGKNVSKVYINLSSNINFKSQLKLFGIQHLENLYNSYCLWIQKLKLKSEKKVQNNQQKNLHNLQSIKNIVNMQEKQQIFIPAHKEDIVLTQDGQYSHANINKLLDILIEWKNNLNQQITPNKKVQQLFQSLQISIENIGQYIYLSKNKRKTVRLAVEKNYGVQFIVNAYTKINKNNVNTSKSINVNAPKSKNDLFLESLVLKQMSQKQVQETASLILKLNHPRIAGVYKFESDQSFNYILMEYLKGISLLDVMNQLGLIPESVIKFYIASLIQVISYLHSQKVVYRNLIPEQIIVDNNGNLFLHNFDYSKKLMKQNKYKTSTLIGTPHYMAPQIIKNQPYSFNVDYWSLGVISYELIYRKFPFGNQTNDPVKIFEEVLNKEVILKKENSLTFFQKILQKDPKKRSSNFQKYLKSEYMSNFQWQRLQKFEYIPPYAPKDNLLKQKRNSNFK